MNNEFPSDDLDRDDLDEVVTERLLDVGSLNGSISGDSNLLDNNLPIGGGGMAFPTKLARINSECTDPVLHQDCVAGQKWKCINEDGRWRKHKCKFHVRAITIFKVSPHLCVFNFQLQMMSQLEKIPRESNRRNCACFVANGVVYTKLKTHSNKNKHQADGTRQKRETDSAALEINEEAPVEIIELIRMNRRLEEISGEHHSENSHGRSKRSASQVSSAIAEVQRNLEILEESFRNSSSNRNGTSEKCFVSDVATGQVNCTAAKSDDNEKNWKRSRHQIDLLIKVLKQKINDLKEIRKDLKENKPGSIKEDYEEVNSKEEELEVESGKVAGKNETEDDLGPLIDMNWYTNTTREGDKGAVDQEREDISTTKPTTTKPITSNQSSTPTITSTNRRRVSKKPPTILGKSTTTEEPQTSTQNPTEEDDTKIPIFYIGEDKEEAPVKPNITTEGPQISMETTTQFIATESTTKEVEIEIQESTSESSSSTTTTESSIQNLGKSVHVETTVFQPTSHTHKPHRHSHGSHGNRSQHNPESRRTTDTSTEPAECFCDLENEK